MPKGGTSAPGQNKFAASRDAVADDRNWIGRVQNELTCVAAWNRDWGFLAGDSDNLKMENATKPYDIDEQIQKVQEELDKINPDANKQTLNQTYGKGSNLEQFAYNNNNINRTKELKCQDRKLPKNWKKTKWTAPDDPLDPLKNLFNKKK